MKKILIVLCGIVIVLVLFGIFSKDNAYAPEKLGGETDIKEEGRMVTDGWKTYSNDKYGFELKYPPEYSIKPISIEKVSQGDSIAIVGKDSNDFQQAIYIYLPQKLDLSANPDASRLDDYTNGYQTKSGSVIVHEQEKLSKNGISFIKQIYSFGRWIEDVNGSRSFYARDEIGEESWHRYVFFDQDRGFIILKSYTSQKNRAETDNLLDKIVSTFRFIR